MKAIVFGVVLTVLLAACGGAGGEFLGKWVDVKNECSTLEVVENGSGYLVKIDAPGFFGREVLTLVGVVKEGNLVVDIKGRAQTLAINKISGELVAGRSQYRRPAAGDKECSLPKR